MSNSNINSARLDAQGRAMRTWGASCVFWLLVWVGALTMAWGCGAKGGGGGDLDSGVNDNQNTNDDGDGGVDPDAFDCPVGRVVCEGVCCEEGEKCREGRCCPDLSVCAQSCCEGDEICMGGICHLRCSNGVRCLDTQGEEMCCLPGQICFMNECINPGTSCSTDADCALDEYCEETVGSCLPIPDSNCEYHPPVGEFTPIVEWAWPDENDPPPMPDYVDVLTPPAVGDMDGDGIPEVGIVSYWDSCVGGGWNTGVLTILRGDTGALLLQHDDPSRRLRSNISPAMGDVDLDGDAEVLVGGADNTIYCYEIDGTLTWESSVPASQANGGIGIADLDVDGVPEVYMGATIFDNRGVLICEGTGGTGGGGGRGFSTAADLDLDGDLELVGGNTAYHHDCSIMWQSGEAGDGYPGVADIYDASGLPGTDGYPEVALIYSGNLQIISGQDGSLLWEVALPGSGYGGAPNISDFDGDGLVEIGTAGGAYMVVFDPDGTEPILWQQPTQDTSSARTGSTVFDFEGDGEAEIVYSDECFVRIYKGSDGTVLFEESNNTRTQHEYPIVVDIDADGNSELVVTANVCVWNCDAYPDWSGPPKRGVKVYGDEDLNWVRTRKVWNQHTYHVTNINDDCSIPSPETANWSAPGLNNFRQNVQTWGVHNAPNMAGDMFGGDPRNCGVGGSIDLGLMVLNQGSKGVPAGINIGFYRVMDNDDVVFLGAAQTTAPLLPGMNEYVEYTWQIPADETPLPSSFTFLAVVDDPAVGEVAIHECVETDNEVGPVEVICDTVE